MHLQEFAENSADMQHFDPLHGRMYIPFTSIAIPGVMVDHDAKWVQDEKEPHVTYFLNHARLEILGDLTSPKHSIALVIAVIIPFICFRKVL